MDHVEARKAHKCDCLYSGEFSWQTRDSAYGQRLVCDGTAVNLVCGGVVVSLGRLNGATGDRDLQRTGRARYAGPTFVVDFTRLLEFRHYAPDKEAIGVGVYLVGRPKGGQHGQLLEVPPSTRCAGQESEDAGPVLGQVEQELR
ncbi:unnamed protein product [Symbiodinium sp. CCMP2592]|nr:unnamed protein product [Symbiodinium sp. CCMP2592]